MTEEELQELEKAVEEARNHLIELNDSYNEILTKEHEKRLRRITFHDKIAVYQIFLKIWVLKSRQNQKVKRK